MGCNMYCSLILEDVGMDVDLGILSSVIKEQRSVLGILLRSLKSSSWLLLALPNRMVTKCFVIRSIDDHLVSQLSWDMKKALAI